MSDGALFRDVVAEVHQLSRFLIQRRYGDALGALDVVRDKIVALEAHSRDRRKRLKEFAHSVARRRTDPTTP